MFTAFVGIGVLGLGFRLFLFWYRGKFPFFKRKSKCRANRRSYEFHVAECLHKLGFVNVRITKARQDGGRDVEGFYQGSRYVVEVKQFSKSKVGVQLVRKIYGVAASEKCNAGFATTIGYTKTAKEFAKKNGIKLRVFG